MTVRAAFHILWPRQSPRAWGVYSGEALVRPIEGSIPTEPLWLKLHAVSRERPVVALDHECLAIEAGLNAQLGDELVHAGSDEVVALAPGFDREMAREWIHTWCVRRFDADVNLNEMRGDELRRLLGQPVIAERVAQLARLEECLVAGENAYDELYDATNSTAAAGYYSEAKDSFGEAIGIARRLGFTAQVLASSARLQHIKDVFRSLFV